MLADVSGGRSSRPSLITSQVLPQITHSRQKSAPIVNGLGTGTASWYTFSEIAFSFQIDGPVLFTGLLLATFTGLLGGFFPAVRAVRLRLVDCLREI